MSRVFTNDGVIIAEVMKNHLNTWEKKPAEIKLEVLDKDPPSMMLQQLAAAEKKTTYVNGSYIGVWSFAIYMRVSGEDTASRLDAIACLNELAGWLCQINSEGEYVNLPEINDYRKAAKIEATSTPSIAARYEDGIEDYQVLMALEYYTIRRN